MFNLYGTKDKHNIKNNIKRKPESSLKLFNRQFKELHFQVSTALHKVKGLFGMFVFLVNIQEYCNNKLLL